MALRPETLKEQLDVSIQIRSSSWSAAVPSVRAAGIHLSLDFMHNVRQVQTLC